ncbi:MAG: ABC transporter permease [Candidatus Bathyarchaeota archaeon]|nr:ABC transporter permease [Candidatus Bathyarchaeota archaeon]
MEVERLIKIISEHVPRRRTPIYRIVLSFVMRDFKIWWTYKFWLLLELSGIVLFVVTYYLFSLITTPQRVQEAGYMVGGYFTFALIGIAFQQYVHFAVQSINESIREEQWNGTMETILSTATDFKVFLLGEVCFSFIVSSALLLMSLAIGVLLGAEFYVTPYSILTAAILTVLLIASHMDIGILSAGVIMKVKQGSPVTWAFSWLSQLVSGVFYPLRLLPWYLEWVGRAFPLTYSLDGIRLCLQSGKDLASPAILSNILSLIIFIALMTPISLYIFKIGYDAARRDGSLGQY